MEDSAADASAGTCGKAGLGGGGCLSVVEADAAEEMAFDFAEIAVEIEAEIGERAHSVGQETFTAGLVDGGLHSVDNFDLEAFVCRCDGGSKTGGACSNDEDIRLR